MKQTITTNVIVYIHSYENLVIGPKEFQGEVASRAAELWDDNDHFSEWLTDTKNLSSGEVFNLTEEERTTLRQEYEEQCAEDVEEELLEDYWTKQEVEVEVEIETEVKTEAES